MECVFNESLRLFPSAPIDYRKCASDDALPDGTFVPAGTEVVYLPWVMGRNPKYFPDPEVFRPERWEEDPAPPSPWSFEWPAFNAGKRSCLGECACTRDTLSTCKHPPLLSRSHAHTRTRTHTQVVPCRTWRLSSFSP
jgi:hypothetical protein